MNSHSRISRRAAGAMVLALGGLLSTYASVVRAPGALAVGTACPDVSDTASLNAALAAVNAGTCDTISITANFTLTANGISTDLAALGATTLTILGNSKTINGGWDGATQGTGFRPFTFYLANDDSLTISDLTITRAEGNGANQRYGGGISVQGPGQAGGFGDVSLQNVSITDSTSGARGRNGGGAYLYAESVVINGGTFARNKGEDAGAVHVLARSSIAITDATFTDNYAYDGGGALYLTGQQGITITLTDSTLTGNESYNSSAGALYVAVQATTTITDTTFRDNSTPGSGGAMYVKEGVATITGSTFDSNTAGAAGGGLYIVDSALAVTDSTFTGNTASAGRGGGIYAENVYSSTFTRVTVTDNYASDGGAGLYLWGQRGETFTITGSTITGNTVTASSAAPSVGLGGGLLVNRPTTITDSTISDNSALNGGGIAVKANDYAPDVPNVTITGTTLEGNSARYAGGAIRLQATFFNGPQYWAGPTPVAITDSRIKDNTALSGSALSTDNGTVTITGSTVSGNTSSGGSVITGLHGSTTTLVGTALVGNSSQGQLEPIILSAGELTLTNSTVTGNTASGSVFDAGGSVGYIRAYFSTIYANTQSGSDALASSYGLRSVGSVIFPSSAGIDISDGFTPAVSYSYTVTNSSFVSANVTYSRESESAASLKFGSLLADSMPGRPSFVPASDSILVTAAPSSGLSTGVTTDQLNVPRGPAGTAQSFVIGARQTGVGPAFVNASPPSRATVGEAYGPYTFTATGPTPLRIYMSGGALPEGMSLDPDTGILSGTPTVSGSYVFAVSVDNAFGTASRAALSLTVAPSGSTPTPTPQFLPRPLKPGQVLVTDGGASQRVTVEPRPSGRRLLVSSPDFAMTLAGLGSSGRALRLGPGGVLVLGRQGDVVTTGRGFKPNSLVNLYIDPQVAPVRRLAAQALFVGSVRTDASGAFSGIVSLPARIKPGGHVLQAVGVTPADSLRAVSLGLLVSEPPRKVRNLRVTAATADGTAGLAWRPPVGAPVTRPSTYLVRYRSTGGGVWRSVGRTAERTTTVTTLVPGCSYYFSVTARNAVGVGLRQVTGPVRIPVGTGSPVPRGDVRCTTPR